MWARRDGGQQKVYPRVWLSHERNFPRTPLSIKHTILGPTVGRCYPTFPMLAHIDLFFGWVSCILLYVSI